LEEEVDFFDDDDHEINLLVEYQFERRKLPEGDEWGYLGYRIIRAWLDGEKIEPGRLTGSQRASAHNEICAKKPDTRLLD
jgi:hypothetical protein